MSRLILSNLTKRYGAITVVDGVDLALEEGEFVSLLGPSGCGKTTTLRMIAGFVPPDGGSIALNGKTISAPDSVLPPERRGMSMIFQSYAIWPNMTVEENVGFGLKLRNLPSAEIRTRTLEMLDTVQMAHLARRYPAELSGGQQQRVALARAIVIKPAVLLLEEPLSNLDANLREEMRFEIRRLHNAFRITTVYVTHDQAEAMATSDRIAVMNAGRVEQIDAPHLLYARPRTRFVAGFIGRTNLIEGTVANATFAADGFSLPASAMAGQALPPGPTLVSLRPQSIALHRDVPDAPNGHPVMQGTILERTYLGESWDYVVSPAESALRLRVAAPPLDVHDVGSAVWLALDPAQLAVVQ
jgi:ABC-type Fe3+/spermidine/putrescine transport system ATPase subunit